MKKIILYILVVSLSLNNFTVFAWVIGGDVLHIILMIWLIEALM